MKQLKTTVYIFILMSLLLGIVYPAVITGVAQLAFKDKANGSLITVNGRIAGSELIGQHFTGARYFHGRPSASNYDACSSGGTNLGPVNNKLAGHAFANVKRIREENGLTGNAEIPADLVLASASGLDPHISIESAMLQVERIAHERDTDSSVVNNMVNSNSEKKYFGIFGDKIVNVLKLNIALDSTDK